MSTLTLVSPATTPATSSCKEESAKFGRLESIDVWRGLAALAVVFVHFPHDAPGGFREHPFFIASHLMDFGYLGVPFFVLISGFCIHRKPAITKARTGSYQLQWKQFWKRRFWRLYPTYLAAIVVSLCTAKWLYADPYFETTRFSADLTTHLLLIHNLTEFATGLTNGAFWSLGMEEQLYGLYFLLFLGFLRFSHRATLWCVALLTIGWRLSVPFIEGTQIDLGPFHLGTWYQWPLQYWLHWTLGALAVDAVMGNVTLPKWTRSIRIAHLLLILAIGIHPLTINLFNKTGIGQRILSKVPFETPIMQSYGYCVELMFLVAFFCYINWGLKRETVTRDWPSWASTAFGATGRISYSLYLTHIPVLHTLQEHLPFDSSPVGWVKRILCYLPIIMTVAAVFYWCVERHFLGVGRKPSE